MDIPLGKFMTLSKLSFKEHLKYFIDKINSNENFTFARYADGERMILNNQSITQGTQAFEVDKWKYVNNITFKNDLRSTCNHREENYYYAISCKCCDPIGEVFYKNLFENHNITFSNLLINNNYNEFIDFVSTLKRDVVLIANKNCLKSEYPFKTILKIPIDNNCVDWYEQNKDRFISALEHVSLKYNNTLFFTSAGPLSEIIIHTLYNKNPNNTYIDIGSSLDIYTHGKVTRPYQNKNSEFNKKECVL
jgi:hypothetical protein